MLNFNEKLLNLIETLYIIWLVKSILASSHDPQALTKCLPWLKNANFHCDTWQIRFVALEFVKLVYILSTPNICHRHIYYMLVGADLKCTNQIMCLMCAQFTRFFLWCALHGQIVYKLFWVLVIKFGNFISWNFSFAINSIWKSVP